MPRDTKGKAVGDETMSAVNMTDMRRATAKKAAIQDNMATKDAGPDYPYGLRVHMDHESMKKVGMKDMPEVGSEVQLHAKAHVVGARAEKREGADEDRHLELQITHMGVHHKPDGMKSQDQGGSGKTAPIGEPSTDKGKRGTGDKKTGADASYSRKRH